MNPKQSRQSNDLKISRRDLLKGMAGLGAAAALSGCSSIPVLGEKNDLVRRETEQLGTRDWVLQNTRIDPKTKYRCPWIEGYCSHTSIRAGETLDIFVSTNPVSAFTLDIYRMGFYGGTGGRHVL